MKPDEVTEVIDEDDYSDLIPPPSFNDPELAWERAKRDFGLTSPSMDKMMKMIGLKEIKEQALIFISAILLDPPPHIDTRTSMNFSFVGNAGCGKTTVATLLGAALVELKYRENPNTKLLSAADILAEKDPQAYFKDMVEEAEGGTIFIDECYLFDPAPKGSRANDSSCDVSQQGGVLDAPV